MISLFQRRTHEVAKAKGIYLEGKVKEEENGKTGGNKSKLNKRSQIKAAKRSR